MSMIFDGFRDRHDMALFIGAVHSIDPGLDCRIYETRQASDAADPFPGDLSMPVVHVPRTDAETERTLERLALRYFGRFAGT